MEEQSHGQKQMEQVREVPFPSMSLSGLFLRVFRPLLVTFWAHFRSEIGAVVLPRWTAN